MPKNGTYVSVSEIFGGDELLLFKLSELRRSGLSKITLDAVVKCILSRLAVQGEEIPLVVSLFSSYTHPHENFAVMINGTYAKLDEVLTEKKPKKHRVGSIEKTIDIYDITFGITHGDGGYESRTDRSRKRLPHHTCWRPDHWKAYYEWKAAVQAYKSKLENRCANPTVQPSLG